VAARKSAMAGQGEVVLVGAGPGDPELLTRRGYALIGEADDLVVDALVPKAVYRHGRGRVVHVGKRAGRPHVSQADICRILVDLARAGRRVVRLKGGDPGVFARAAEEIDALEAAGVRWSVVPGVSSVLAAAAAARLPLTARGNADRIVVITGTQAAGERPELPPYDPCATLVVLMGLAGLDALCADLLKRGFPPSTPAVLVSNASLPQQQQVTGCVRDIGARAMGAGLSAPATLIVGAVAGRVTVGQDRCAAGVGGPR
jgi:uroporphyrin-III C-methyltransferase